MLPYTIEEIRRRVVPVAQKYGLPAVYLFGAYARGEANAESDVDLLVDTAGTELNTLFELGGLYNDLEETLEIPINLVTMGSLDQRPQLPSEAVFQDNVRKERVKLYVAA